VLEDDRWRADTLHANLAAFSAHILVEVTSDLSSTTSFADWERLRDCATHHQSQGGGC
jgi:hypothetical protein